MDQIVKEFIDELIEKKDVERFKASEQMVEKENNKHEKSTTIS